MNRLVTGLLCILIISGQFYSCKKSANTAVPVPADPAKDTIPSDPSVAATIGFFMDNWAPRNFTIPAYTVQNPITANAGVTVTVNTGQVITKIASNYFGNNSNLWCGQLNTQSSLVSHLVNFQPRIIRGPAGSISDIFFFNRNNNNPPADAPDSLLNASGVKSPAGYWYGKNTESWTFSIDGYYNLLQQTTSKGLLTVNYGYARYGTSANPVAAAAHLAADWVRYDRGRTPYWEIGNECFGEWEAGYRINTATNHDGQPEIITGALYGSHFKVFADSMRAAAAEMGVSVKIGAVLYDSPPAAWNTNTVKTWNSGYFSTAGDYADFYAVHNYFTPYQQNSDVHTIFSSASTVPGAVKNYVLSGLNTAGLPVKPLAMTEWNLFCSGSRQNVSAVAGIHSVLALNESIRNQYGASLRWDLANAWANGDDHGMFSNGDEPGVARWSPRPAFYYMYYFQQCTGDRMLASSVSGSADVISMASTFSSGQKAVMLVNKGTTSQLTEVKFQYFTPGNRFYYYVLTPGTDNGDFSGMVKVNGEGPATGTAGGPAGYASIKMYAASAAAVKLNLPAHSVVFMVVDKR